MFKRLLSRFRRPKRTTGSNYYLMPNGTQAWDITRYLNSNGGQAVQYIIRSSRIDGVVKDDPISDWGKVIDFARNEIDRLQEEENRA